MTSDLTDLMDALARCPTADDVYNPYAYGIAYNDLRRDNLGQYLAQMIARQPRVLLVMEAPGYRGCRLTGVPVTSRNILLHGLPSLAMFGEARGYKDVPEPPFAGIQREQSATIVWEALSALGIAPLIWNAFPFHPHRAGQPLSNRTPRKAEIAVGGTFLQKIITIYQPAQVIAIGRVAQGLLSSLDVNHEVARHPAQGGKNDFIGGLTRLLTTKG